MEEKKTEKKYYDFRSIAQRTEQDVYFVAPHDKNLALILLLEKAEAKQRIVVCKSKKSADILNEHLKSKGFKSLTVHGNHRAEQVEDARASFIAGEINIIITTDTILQVLELKEKADEMISYDVPIDTQDYFNRIRLVDEVGHTITFVSSDDEKNFETLEYVMRCEMQEKEIEDFTPTPAPRKEKKNKKPRHKKKKIKTPEQD